MENYERLNEIGKGKIKFKRLVRTTIYRQFRICVPNKAKERRANIGVEGDRLWKNERQRAAQGRWRGQHIEAARSLQYSEVL